MTIAVAKFRGVEERYPESKTPVVERGDIAPQFGPSICNAVNGPDDIAAPKLQRRLTRLASRIGVFCSRLPAKSKISRRGTVQWPRYLI